MSTIRSKFKQTTFKDDGYKRILCPNCGAFLTELHLGEEKVRTLSCSNCKVEKVVRPPVKANYLGVNGYWVEGNDSWFTAVDEI